MREVTDNYDDHDDLLNEVVFENRAKELQIRFTVSEFRGNYYMGLRKWVIDIDDSWIPTKSGFTWLYNLDTTSSLFSAFCKTMSRTEVMHEIAENTKYLKKPDQ